MPDQHRPSYGCRRFQLSVRGLVVLVLVIGCFLGWIVRIVHGARVQREAVAAIGKAPCFFVWYAWQWRDEEPILDGKPWWPQSLVDTVGADYFGDVVGVVSSSGTATYAEMIPIGQLSRLQKLWLSTPFLTDDGLMHLRSLTRLRTLALSNALVGNSGLAHLKGLRSLQSLVLENTQVTDAGLVSLKSLSRLETLSLRGTTITDAGLAHLKGLNSLRNLDLRGTEVTDTGAQALQKALPHLKIVR
jgi:internalin A